jgi:transcription initiation factor IIE alpha subunit
MILKMLVEKPFMAEKDIVTSIGIEKERTGKILSDLIGEGFITKKATVYRIAE